MAASAIAAEVGPNTCRNGASLLKLVNNLPAKMELAQFESADGQEGTMELLLRAGANVAARSDHGETPLMAAVTNDQAMIVQRLLSRVHGLAASNRILIPQD